MTGTSIGEPMVRVLPDAAAATAAAADRIIEALTEAVRLRRRADWATTGGSTAVPIYGELASPARRGSVPWPDIHVWWGDDRFVPRDHPLSNRQPFDEIMLGAAARAGESGTGEVGVDIDRGTEPGVPIPVANVHGMPIDAALVNGTPASAAADYEAALRASPLRIDASGFPIFDVVLVGVGPDGHVLSVFPGSPLFGTTAWVSGVVAPEHVAPVVARVSLNPRVLSAAREPVVVALGSAKADVIARLLDGPRDERRLPAQLARRAGATWILDAAAAAALAWRDPGR